MNRSSGRQLSLLVLSTFEGELGDAVGLTLGALAHGLRAGAEGGAGGALGLVGGS